MDLNQYESDFICDIFSLYIQSGNEHLCTGIRFRFVPELFCTLCFFFGNGLLFFQHEHRVKLWRKACASSGLR